MTDSAKSFYNLLTKYRMALFGFATIWIFFRHVFFFNLESYGMIDFITQIGDCGVDIFLFLSGFGCFYSYRNNLDISLFYKKRTIRILPTVVLLLVSFSLIDCFFWGNSIKNLFSPFRYFYSIYAVYWFIGAIIFFYLSFPLLYKVVSRHPLQTVLVSYIIAVICVYIINVVDINITKSLNLYFARIPIFILGIVFAKYNTLFNRKRAILILTFISIPLLFILPKDYQRIAYSVFSIGIISVLPNFFDYTPHIVNRGVSKIGECSFEFYIIHIFAFNHALVKIFFVNDLPFLGGGVSLVVIVFVSFLFHKLITVIQEKMKCFLI